MAMQNYTETLIFQKFISDFFIPKFLAIFSICLALTNQINAGFTGLFPNFALKL